MKLYVDSLRELVACFEFTRGDVRLLGRSDDGFGARDILLQRHVIDGRRGPLTLPHVAIELMTDSWMFRVCPVTGLGGAIVDLPVITASWKPPATCSRATGWRYVVDPAARDDIARALRGLPPATVHVEAGPRLWAGWRLRAPLSRPTEIREALAALARQLDAEAPPDDLSAAALPFGGTVRGEDWNRGEFIAIADVDASRIYTLDEILKEQTDVRSHEGRGREDDGSGGAVGPGHATGRGQRRQPARARG